MLPCDKILFQCENLSQKFMVCHPCFFCFCSSKCQDFSLWHTYNASKRPRKLFGFCGHLNGVSRQEHLLMVYKRAHRSSICWQPWQRPTRPVLLTSLLVLVQSRTPSISVNRYFLSIDHGHVSLCVLILIRLWVCWALEGLPRVSLSVKM